jgi:K+-transporting ATPase KdpF subunit
MRWIRAPARPSAVASKSAVFARDLRHLRRRGTSLCLCCVSGFFLTARSRPARYLGRPFCRATEVERGHRLHSRHSGPLCGLPLDRLGDLASREQLVSAAYLISGLLALGLCVYLLYAMFKPEKF